MKNLRPALLLLVLVPFAASAAPAAAPSSGVAWRPWSDDLFIRAKKERKFVVLDLVAVWCHWCHVMDEKTYGSSDVARLLGERFLTVRVDQDARPDISARYEDSGWPATIIFAPDGRELVKMSGYIPADKMLSLLQAVVDDPTPGPSVRPERKRAAPAAATLTPALRRELEAAYLETYDAEHGSWGYALAYAEWHDAEHLRSARDIRRYLDTFLKSPEGAFYVSQDADPVPGEHGGEYFALDDAGRRARGIPRVDTHLYARENGWVVDALVTLWTATKEPAVLDEAVTAARWVVAERSLGGEGFRHDAVDPAGPYLGDTLAMGRAFVSLYEATSDREWRDRASAAADFIARHFALPKGAGAGYASLATTSKVTNVPRRPNRDENVLVVRFATALARATGDPAHGAMAAEAMRFLATHPVATVKPVGPVLLADREIGSR